LTLDDDDIEAIAQRIVDKLRPPTDALVGVREVAGVLGVRPNWVYRNADALGVVRLGSGRGARLRFDLRRTLEAARGLGVVPPAAQATTPRRRGRPREAPPGVELIPLRGGRRP
jgi:hypothetical protein